MIDSKTLQINDGRVIGYAEFGDPNGKPIFYFHGFPGSRLEASHLHDVAASNHYRIISIDRPGMGLSSLHPNLSLLSFAKDIAQVADLLHIGKFSIIGYSAGGPFVVACAYQIPDRVHGVVIVSGIAPFDIPETAAAMSRGQLMANKLIKTMPWLASVMMRITRRILRKPSKRMAQMMVQLPEVDQAFVYDSTTNNDIIASSLEAFREGIEGPSAEIKLLLKPWGFDLAAIHCAVTIWQGTLDTQVPMAHAKIYDKFIPGAKLKMIEGEGHHSLIRNHAEDIFKHLGA